MNFNSIVNTAVRITKSVCKTHGTEILTGGSIIGSGYSIYSSIKATIKSVKKVEEKKEEYGVEELPKKEIVKLVWKNYIPTAASFLLSSGGMISATSINVKKIALLDGALTYAVNELETYKKKVPELVGHEKAKQIENDVNKTLEDSGRKIDAYHTNYGNELIYEPITGVKFYSDRNCVKESLITMNMELLENGIYNMFDLLYEWGVDTIPNFAHDIGWSFGQAQVRISFTPYYEENGQIGHKIIFNEDPTKRYLKDVY